MKSTSNVSDEVERLVLSMFIGDKCPYCGRVFNDLDSLRKSVWAGKTPAHRGCCRLAGKMKPEAELRKYLPDPGNTGTEAPRGME